ncbi:hypothetical protein SK571_14625 [Lentzea sp. BCCO 10_0798]|uniref:Uncharacterized protein n=1 Tax=Lentzea kristufekii TaxID=3095430 RepID=A0ABU4TRS5_9PSEU|nr:hypothetical protein [Lentzea sp. BCCO 10_0798]MDX8050622.1 hypothetical protein [Lentzea sp. BCCO 10_0798]
MVSRRGGAFTVALGSPAGGVLFSGAVSVAVIVLAVAYLALAVLPLAEVRGPMAEHRTSVPSMG